MINEKEKLIIADMLDQISDKQSNSCCNDWNFPDDWSEEEKYEFIYSFHEWNGDLADWLIEFRDNGKLYISDFCVSALLAVKLRREL